MAKHRPTALTATLDAQQTGYLSEREARFTAMPDVLGQLLPEQFVVLDLACGFGAISQRLLACYPHASTIAIDVDPVLLMLGQQILSDYNGRLHWIDADLREPAWGYEARRHVDECRAQSRSTHAAMATRYG